MSLKGKWYALYLRREPASLALLFGLLVVFFAFVTGLSRIYFAQQQALAVRWSERGTANLKDHNYVPAVDELRAALRYSRDNQGYQLSLAEALIGLDRTSEAEAYLVNLWEEQPENGRVNLDLARVAVQEGLTRRALRYYHNAIYANWPEGDQVAQIRDARIELIQYLLRIKSTAQAQSELISLQVYLGDDTAYQKLLGDMFSQTGDYDHALSAYRLSLSAKPRDAATLAGAGNAAFQLGRYELATRYLRQNLALDSSNKNSRDQLHMADLVLRMDPFRAQIPTADRYKAVVNAFQIASKRLDACPVAASYASSTDPKKDLSQEWSDLERKVTPAGLRRDPDLANTTMDLVFTIERQANIWCGSPSDTDRALLLIARLHEGS
ncbi:MAG: hypothetical protein KGN79_09315 [Acidobacteriota bacterium]|nr:hypothetical protein [Acidobacteriota bacterium]